MALFHSMNPFIVPWCDRRCGGIHQLTWANVATDFESVTQPTNESISSAPAFAPTSTPLVDLPAV